LANTKSAKKAMRVAERRRIRNKPIRSATRTYYRKAVAATTAGDTVAAEQAIVQAISALDKAAHKKVIHPNNAARRKSRLMARLNRARAEAQSA
jgi:small subunit ribosomal protein S20